MTAPALSRRLLSIGLSILSAGCWQSEGPRTSDALARTPEAAVQHSVVQAGVPRESLATDASSRVSEPRGVPPGSSEPQPVFAPPAEPPAFREAFASGETGAQRVSKRIANASPSQCRAELKRRKLSVTFVGGNVAGVAMPVRLSGELGGVRFLTPGRNSVYGIADCRLVIVLDELAALLAPQGVVAVHVDNMYRPRSRLPGSRKKSQHAYGLAVDIYGFTMDDGTTLVVERDFDGALGTVPCGPGANLAPDAAVAAVTLRNLTCSIARSRLFNHLLSPNYDAAHRNHLHADIRRGGREWVVR